MANCQSEIRLNTGNCQLHDTILKSWPEHKVIIDSKWGGGVWERPVSIQSWKNSQSWATYTSVKLLRPNIPEEPKTIAKLRQIGTHQAVSRLKMHQSCTTKIQPKAKILIPGKY